MDLEKIKQKSLLEWAFCWNQLRLVIAGATLLLGKQSPILTYFSIPLITPVAGSFMSLAWVISGLSAVYIIISWQNSDKTIFGGNDKKDMTAFWIATITGINLGIAGIFTNIGFLVTPNILLAPLMFIAGLAYFWATYHLHSRGGAKALFVSNSEKQNSVETE